MKPAERQKWIKEYLQARCTSPTDRGPNIDVLHSDFVCRYADETQAPSTICFVGAPKCPTLGRDLAAMYKAGVLRRYRTGISGVGYGFPTWVWVYQLSEAERAAQAAKQGE